jgi:hypothetical protein
MSFLRHGESINPMRLVPLGASGLAHSQCPSASMSSSRLFLGRLLSSSEIPDLWSGQTGKEQWPSRRSVR